MSGYCSTGKVNNPMMPRMTIVMEMTAEKTDQSGNSGTEFQEIPAGDAFLQAFFVDRQSFIFHILVYFVDSS